MLITPNQPFLEGTDRYEAGVEYEVSDEVGGRAVSHRWASSPDVPDQVWSDGVAATTLPGPVELEVHDSSQGQSTEVL